MTEELKGPYKDVEKPLTLISADDRKIKYNPAEDTIKKYIDMLMSSGLYAQAKDLKYSEVIACMTKKDLFDFGSLEGDIPIIAGVYIHMPEYKPECVINLSAIDPNYAGEHLHISHPQVLLESLMYGSVVTKMYIEIHRNRSLLFHMTYQHITDIYYSIIFRLLGKPYGLLELDQIKQGTLRYCFAKYIAENWFENDVEKAHMYAVQSTLSGKIIEFENRNKFIEEIREKGLHTKSFFNLPDVISYLSKDIVIGIDLNKFIQMLYTTHGLYSIVAFERFHYFMATVIGSKFGRKIPVSSFFAQVHKNATNQLVKVCDTVMSKKFLSGC